MKKSYLPSVFSVVVLSTFAVGCANTNNSNNVEADSTTTAITEQSTELEKVGYSIGYGTAKNYKESLDDLDLEAFELGFRDAYADKDSVFSEEQMQTIVMAYQQKKQAEMLEKSKEDAKVNKVEGDAFLAENAKKEGVITTDSGLQYKVLKPGTGATVKPTDIVKVNYEGKLIDGTVFDSSYERKEPAIFAAQQMIPGFAEGLSLMKVGGTYELYIPSALAYGETGNPAIEANSTLIFKVEVLEVNPEMAEQIAIPQQ